MSLSIKLLVSHSQGQNAEHKHVLPVCCCHRHFPSSVNQNCCNRGQKNMSNKTDVIQLPFLIHVFIISLDQNMCYLVMHSRFTSTYIMTLTVSLISHMTTGSLIPHCKTETNRKLSLHSLQSWKCPFG